LKKDEIVYCNLTVISDGKKKKINQVVYKEKDGYYKGERVIEVDLIKIIGYANNTNDYTEVKKSNEQRNTVTGAYE